MSNISQEEVKLFKSITNSDDPTATRYLERYHDVNTAISNYFAEQESNKKSSKSATNDYDPKPNRKKIGKSTTVSKETKVTQVSEGNSSDSKDFMFLDSNMEEEKQAKPKKVISNSSKPKKLDDTTSFFMGATGFDENTTTAFLLCLLNTALKSPKIQYNMKNRQNNSKSNNNSVKNSSNNNTSLFSREVKSKKDEKTNIYRPSSSKNLALRLRGSYNGYMKKYNKESGLLGDKTPEWPKYLGSAVVECHIVNQDLLMKIKARDEIHFEPEEIDYNSTNVYKKTKGGGRVVSGKRWTIKSTSLLVRCLWSGMFLGYLSCKHEEMFVFLLNRKYVLLEGLVVDNVEHFTGVKLYSTKLKLQIDVFLTKEVVTNPLNIAPIRRKAGRGLKVPDGDELESKRDQQRQQVLRYSKEALTKLFKMMKLRVTIATMVKAKQKVDLFHRIEKEKSEAASKPRSDYCGGPKGSAAEVITEDFAKYYALQAQEEEQRKNVENQFNGVSAENQSLKPPPKKHIMIHSDGSDSSGYEDEDDDNVSDGPDNNDRESRPLNWVTGRSGKGQADLRNGVVNEAPVVEEEGEKNKQNQDLLNTNHISSYYITTEPPKALKTSMHPYQKQALSWMIYREGCLEKEELFAKKPDEQRVLNDLFQEMELLDGCKLYFNPFNGEVTAELPVVKACKGGILADEMGLGKTVMAISLLHKHQRHRTEREVQGHLNWLNDEEEDEDDKKEERKVIKAGNKAKGKTMIELEEEEEEEEDENGSDDYSDQEEEIKIKNELKKARKSRTTVGKKKGKGDDSDEDFEISDEEEYMPYRDQTLGKRQLDQKISLSEEDEKQEPEVTKKVKDEKSTKVELKRRDSFDDLIDDLTSRKSNKLVVEEPKSASKKALNKAQTTISKAFDYKSSAKTTTKNAEKPTNIFNSFKFAPKPTKPAEEPKPNPKDLKVEKEKREKKQKEIVKGLGKPAGTLIVVPVTVLGQWESEIHKHSRPGSLSVFQYYGSSRKKDITKYDVVLTTYGLVESEYKQLLKDKTKSKLFECEWFRIILDEAHYIRTRQAKTTKAVCALMAEYRWCLTGTPLQNKLDDMYSLFQFLKMDTWGEYFWWNSYINKHTSNEEASHLIRSILKPIILRRTKTSTYLDGKSILALPPKEIKTHMVKLSQEERSIYQRFFQGSQKQFNDIVKQGSLQYEYAHIFELILRLRQVCDHPCIVFSKEDLKDSASIEDAVKNFLERKNQSDKKNSKSGDSKEAMDTEFLQKTLKRLKSQDFEPCSICLEEVTEPAIANCGHIFCKECLELSLKRSKRCPLCQKEISAKDVMAISLAENENNMDLLDVDGANFKKSSKLEAVLDAVHKVGSKGEKVVIFSQFVTMLNLMEKFMKDEGVVFRRIDGSCTLKQRERSIQEFNTDKRVTVFLISLKAGAIGLNLTVATNVFLVDPWWNPAVEDQAIERVHRIGQEKNVNVIRFICEKTIEERIQELKQRKKEMIKEVLQFNPQEQKKQNIENMIYIMRGFDDEEEENRR